MIFKRPPDGYRRCHVGLPVELSAEKVSNEKKRFLNSVIQMSNSAISDGLEWWTTASVSKQDET